jgi:uncharacterized protein with von Willebrand factor type A (vWA) domain
VTGHLTSHLVALARELRREGVGVTSQQAALFAEALTHVGVADRLAVRDAARATLSASRDDMARVDAAFERLWRAGVGTPPAVPPPQLPPRSRLPPAEVAIARRLGRGADDTPEPVSDRAQTWSATERLRHKRFERLTDAEAEIVARLMARSTLPAPERVTRRFRAAVRGRALDWRRTVRAAVRHDGEILERRWRTRRRSPRPLVVLVDVSGSMERYARLLLTWLHALVQRSRRGSPRWTIDVFVFGTRLTRITAALQLRTTDAALGAMSGQVSDWSGGTRIGESLRAFNRHWSRRVLGRGAAVALVSDGWDQGDPALVSHELARLRRAARRVCWLNPLMALPGYTAATAALVAAQPSVDAMLPAGDLAQLERALRTMAAL